MADQDDNLKQFNKELDDFCEGIPEKIIAFQKKLVLEALRRLVMKTPVDTGRARGNWQVTIADPAKTQIEALDKSGNETIQKGLAVLSDLPPYNVVWISNNVDYIEFLEAGSSQQAPQGMLVITVEELRTMFKEGLE